MNEVVVLEDVRDLKSTGDIRLTVKCSLIEKDRFGGRAHPYFAWIHFVNGGYSELSIDLEPKEWQKVIKKLQKHLPKDE